MTHVHREFWRSDNAASGEAARVASFVPVILLDQVLERDVFLRIVDGALREDIEETLTLTLLGVTGTLRRTLCPANPIESMFDTVRTTQRNVKRWQDRDM